MKKNGIRLSIVVDSSDVRMLGTALDSQTDSVKKNRIRLSVVNPSVSLARNDARRPDNSVKKNRIRLPIVDSSDDRHSVWKNPYRSSDDGQALEY